MRLRALALAAALAACSGEGARVSLSADGVVRAGGRAVTLEGLCEQVRKAPCERHSSTLRVLLRVHPDAPWQHLQMLFTVFMEEHVRRVELATTRGDRVQLLLQGG